MADEQIPSPKALAAALKAYEILTVDSYCEVRDAVTSLNLALARAARRGVRFAKLETEIFPVSEWNKDLACECLQVIQPTALRGMKDE